MSRIGWDIDGTLTKFDEFVLREATKYMKAKYDMDVVYPDKYDLDLVFDVKNVLIQRGYSEEKATFESERILKDFWNLYYPKYCLEPFREEVKETIEKLKADGDENFAISSRKKTTEESVLGRTVRGMALLQIMLNGVPFDRVIFAENDEEKLKIIKRNYIDIMIEDKPEMITEVSKFTEAICVSNPYNKNVTSLKVDKYKDGEMYNAIQKVKKEITVPLISPDTPPTNKPSEDKLWMQYYSKTDMKWANDKMSPYDRIMYSNIDHPNDITYSYFNKKTKFSEFKNKVEACAKKLVADGIKSGDKVALLVVNTPDTVVMMCALMKIMATIVPISPTDNVISIEKKIAKTDSKLLYMVDYWDEKENCFVSDKIRSVCKKLGIAKIIYSSVDNGMPLAYKLGYRLKMKKQNQKPNYTGEFISFNDHISKGQTLDINTEFEYNPDYLALLVHTGGTVDPKPVMITGENIDAEVRHYLSSRMNIKRGEKISGFLPFDHIFGIIINYMVPLTKGVSVVLRPKIDRSRLDVLFKKDKIDYLATIPVLLEEILKNPRLKKKDLTLLKQIFSGSEVINDKLLKNLNEFFVNAKTIDGYGATELTATLLEGGKPILGADVKIVNYEDENYEELGYNQIGELCVSGSSVTPGYFLSPEKTEMVLRVHKDGKVWYHTGDLALVDLNGKFSFKGRIAQDIIKVNGKMVNLHSVGEVIGTYPFVKKCVVVGAKNEKKGRVPIAIIQLETEKIIEKDAKAEIMELCKRNLSYYEIPGDFLFVDSIPLTSRGKINKKALEEMAEEKLKTQLDDHIDSTIDNSPTLVKSY